MGNKNRFNIPVYNFNDLNNNNNFIYHWNNYISHWYNYNARFINYRWFGIKLYKNGKK